MALVPRGKGPLLTFAAPKPRLVEGVVQAGMVPAMRPAERTDAMDLVFQGSSWRNKGLTPDCLARARSFFEKAVALDPKCRGYGRFGAGRYVTCRCRYDRRNWSSRFAAAETTITNVLTLTPNHAWAHTALGFLQIFTKRAAEGIAECEQALTLDRNLARAHAYIGLAKYLLGRGEETGPHINEALRLSPSFSMDGMGRPSQDAARYPRPKQSSGCVGGSTQTAIILLRISISRPYSRG
jgi:tetratricopeptide (TPR) repeat protein